MGTRHLTCVQSNGKYKIAQYGQWDGYPEGQGTTILSFLKKLNTLPKIDVFINKVNATVEISKEKLKDNWVLCGADRNSDMVSFDISEKFHEKFPELSRDTGAKILEIVNKKSKGLEVRNDIDFAGDSLMCEYCYIIDLDKETFEIYRGFNTKKLDPSERFASLEYDKKGYWKDKYKQVKHWKTYKLNDLPTQKAFLSDLIEEE